MKIFCSWVGAEVDEELLVPVGCHPDKKSDGCHICKLSAQIEYGVSPEELLKRMKDE